MSAKEIIANTAVEGRYDPIGMLHAEAIVQMLTFVGYRIVGPDEVDPVSIEKAAKVAANLNVAGYHPDDLYRFRDVTALASVAIRAIASGGK